MTLSNNPPGMTELAVDVMQALSDWMAEHPVIEGEDDAREAKLLVDRGKLTIQDLEAERGNRVKPLNEQVAAINETYRQPRETLKAVLDELGGRLGAFIRREESEKLRAAAAARQRLEEAERVAREAEAAAIRVRDEASAGVIGGDVAATVLAADDAYLEYEKAQRQAALAEKETHVKVGGGFKRAIALRTEVTLEVIDAVAALTELYRGRALGMVTRLDEAIVKEARAYKKFYGKYPPGIRAIQQRKV